MTKAEIKNIIASLRDGIEYATEQLQKANVENDDHERGYWTGRYTALQEAIDTIQSMQNMSAKRKEMRKQQKKQA